MIGNEVQLGVLHDHYKDTFLYQREYLKQRDRLFVYVLLVFISMFLFLSVPTESYQTISDFAKDKIGLGIKLNSKAIDSMLWFILLSFTIRYFQINIVVERQYKYLEILELELNSHVHKQHLFQREGKGYAEHYKLFPDTVWYIYTLVFPFLLIIILSIKIFAELFDYQSFELTLILDIIFYLMILISTSTYMISYHFKK